ncbi:17479_t:CDS:1, partial [Dentiscutata erythropus]
TFILSFLLGIITDPKNGNFFKHSSEDDGKPRFSLSKLLVVAYVNNKWAIVELSAHKIGMK